MARVRPAVAVDAEGVRALWVAVAAEGEWIGAELPLRDDWIDTFYESVAAPNSDWLVAEVDGAVIGAVWVRERGGLAHLGMAVAADHRGLGVGRELLDGALDWARSHGCHKVSLEVWPHNERARRLYETAGFVAESHLRRHYRRRNGELWDAVGMGLVLDEDSPSRP